MNLGSIQSRSEVVLLRRFSAGDFQNGALTRGAFSCAGDATLSLGWKSGFVDDADIHRWADRASKRNRLGICEITVGDLERCFDKDNQPIKVDYDFDYDDLEYGHLHIAASCPNGNAKRQLALIATATIMRPLESNWR